MISPGHTTPAVILDKTVTLNTWGCELTTDQEAWVIQRFSDAAALLNSKAKIYSPEIISAIACVDMVIVPASNQENLGAFPGDGMTLSLPYLQRFSVEWFASLFGHEGQHHRNRGEFTGSETFRDEQSACITQLALGEHVGMPANERAWLRTWMSDANAAALLAHMNGYAGPT